jgi:hypothetical protein
LSRIILRNSDPQLLFSSIPSSKPFPKTPSSIVTSLHHHFKQYESRPSPGLSQLFWSRIKAQNSSKAKKIIAKELDVPLKEVTIPISSQSSTAII